MRLFVRIFLGVLLASMLLLGVAWIAKLAPGAPLIGAAIGIGLFLMGVRLLRSAGRTPPTHEGPAEDVADLDVFFVCAECGTEFRVEKLGELQVPRHCGERMVVERRPRVLPDLN